MYVAMDTETSGLMNFKLPADDPSQPRIASLGLVLVNEALEIEREHHFLIKPDGWEISAEITKLTGLTMDRLNAEGVPIVEAMTVYTTAILEGRTVVCHNSQFDMKMCRSELRRLGMPDLFEQSPNLCTMRALTDVCKIPPHGNRGGYKFPKLSEACVFFGLTEYGDHSSLNDARAVVGLMRAMRERGIPLDGKVHYAKDDNPAKPAGSPSRAEREAQ